MQLKGKSLSIRDMSHPPAAILPLCLVLLFIFLCNPALAVDGAATGAGQCKIGVGPRQVIDR